MSAPPAPAPVPTGNDGTSSKPPDWSSAEYSEYSDLTQLPQYDESYQMFLQNQNPSHSATSANQMSSVPSAPPSSSLSVAINGSAPLSLPVPPTTYPFDPNDPEYGRSLYVENLPIPMGEDELTQIFKPYGTLEKVTVSMDKSSGQQLGYGFVLYHSPEAAAIAMRELEGLVLRGRNIRVSIARSKAEKGRSQRDHLSPTLVGMGVGIPMSMEPVSLPPNVVLPNGLPPPNTNLYVANFPTSWDRLFYESFFSKYGTIVESKILIDLQTRESKGVGFVRFADESSVTEAIRDLQGKQLEGADMPIVVRPATDKKTMAARGYLAAAQQTQQSMSNFGPRTMGQSLAGNRFNPITRPAGPSGQTQSSFNVSGPPSNPGGESVLFVLYLPLNVQEDDLRALFAQHGAVTQVQIPRERDTQQPKGYAFIHMPNYVEALNACTQCNGFGIGSKRLKVQFKDAKDRESHASWLSQKGGGDKMGGPTGGNSMGGMGGSNPMMGMGGPMGMMPMMPMMGMPPMMHMPNMQMPPMMPNMFGPMPGMPPMGPMGMPMPLGMPPMGMPPFMLPQGMPPGAPPHGGPPQQQQPPPNPPPSNSNGNTPSNPQ